jgi:protein SCO1
MSTRLPNKLSRRQACTWLGLACTPWLPNATAAKAVTTAWESLPELPDVLLQDHQGRSVRFVRDILQDRVFVLNFIFTGCSTVCPPQTALLKQARDTMQPTSTPIVWLSLSVDPLADTPAALNAYRKKFDISTGPTPWYFLTGEPNTVTNLRTVWGDRSRDPNEHLSRLIIGSAASRRYTRMDAFSPPHLVAQRVQELMP